MKVKSPFELWVSGEGSLTCLEDAIDHWHSRTHGSDSLELIDYLGMTSEQFEVFALNPTEFERIYPHGSGVLN